MGCADLMTCTIFCIVRITHTPFSDLVNFVASQLVFRVPHILEPKTEPPGLQLAGHRSCRWQCGGLALWTEVGSGVGLQG